MNLFGLSGGSGSKYLQSFAKLVATLRSSGRTSQTCTVIEQSCGGLISSSILMQPNASQIYMGSSIIYNTKRSKPLLLNNEGLYQSIINPNNNNTNQHQPLSLVSTTTASTTAGTTTARGSGISNIQLYQLLKENGCFSDSKMINDDNEKDQMDEILSYIQSKIHWTTQTAIQYCTTMETSYAIAEGGAVGPTFRPQHMNFGCAVIAIAGRRHRQLQSSSSSTSPLTIPNDNATDATTTTTNPATDVVQLLRQEIIIITSQPANDRISNMYTFAQLAAEICTDVVIIESGSTTNQTTTTAISGTSQQLSSSSSSSSSSSPQLRNNDPMVELYHFDRSSSHPIRTEHSTMMMQKFVSSSNETTTTTKFIVLHHQQILVSSSISDATTTTNNNHSYDKHSTIAYLHQNEVQELLLNLLPENDESITIGLFHGNERMEGLSFLGIRQKNTNDSTTTDKNNNNNSEAIFAIDLTSVLKKSTRQQYDNDSIQQQLDAKLQTDGKYAFVNTRSTLPLLGPTDSDIVLYGTALMEWKRRNRYCSNCGSPDVSYVEGGGTVGQCTLCRTKFWPRQDPSIIVLIVSHDQQRILLANHVRHQHTKIYTTLAGFVEVGETFECAVVREVFEETGIRVDTTVPMQYIGTQSWPFPQSCMIGFIATADDRHQQIQIDPNEIYDAQWFTKADILEATTVLGSTLQTEVTERALQQNPNLAFVIPPKGVIARKLIDTWLLGQQHDTVDDPVNVTAAAPEQQQEQQQQQQPGFRRIRII